MSLPPQIQVLVVGAGPTGLASAIALAKHGLQVAIVDSSPTNQNGSRASVVHARTLEVLDQIGLAKPIVDNGIVSTKVVIHGTTNKLIEFDLSQLRDDTEFPFSVLIPQDEVERLFRERLASDGIQPVRNKTVTSLRQADNVPGMDLSFEDGSVIRAQYVVGADGSRSTIRHLVGVDFKNPYTGVTYEDTTAAPAFSVILADVYLKDPMPKSIPRNRLSGHFDNFFMLIPLQPHVHTGSKSSSFWRVIFRVPDGSTPPKNASLEYLQQQVDEHNPWDTRIVISSVTSSSRYRVRDAVASSYFQKLGNGNVLLVGDAAHVHSPAGGQGMNLGICDAIAVANAISLHAEEWNLEQRDDALQHYADSRRMIAIRVIRLTKGLEFLIRAKSGWRWIVRKLIIPLMSYLPFVRRNAAWRVSGLINRDG